VAAFPSGSPIYRSLRAQPKFRGGYLRFFDQYVQQIPIPNSSPVEREAISSLVQKCLEAKGEGCEEYEREIDERVATLYGLDLKNTRSPGT
jgi:hypothetical protein